jgi:hypothetical protein
MNHGSTAKSHAGRHPYSRLESLRDEDKKLNISDKVKIDTVQIRLTSSVETILASLQPYAQWMEQMLDAPLSETLTLEVDANPADAVAEELLHGLPVVSATKARNSNWRSLIEDWVLPPGVDLHDGAQGE